MYTLPAYVGIILEKENQVRASTINTKDILGLIWQGTPINKERHSSQRGRWFCFAWLNVAIA